ALAERVKAQVRARVEHPFRVVKRQFGYVKVRYRGLAKNTAQLTTLFALSNLWMVRHTVRVGEGGACPEAFGRRPGGPAEASKRSADRSDPLWAGGTTSRWVTDQIPQTPGDRSRRN
ncbi:MAG: transposase, partial [Chloroflexi bacterium]|nr:transposase [Chloroflexota bacterium]